jgi:hypothetical protein
MAGKTPARSCRDADTSDSPAHLVPASSHPCLPRFAAGCCRYVYGWCKGLSRSLRPVRPGARPQRNSVPMVAARGRPLSSASMQTSTRLPSRSDRTTPKRTWPGSRLLPSRAPKRRPTQRLAPQHRRQNALMQQDQPPRPHQWHGKTAIAPRTTGQPWASSSLAPAVHQTARRASRLKSPHVRLWMRSIRTGQPASSSPGLIPRR